MLMPVNPPIFRHHYHFTKPVNTTFLKFLYARLHTLPSMTVPFHVKYSYIGLFLLCVFQLIT